MEGTETLYCAECQCPLQDALIMKCEHNLCLHCARKALHREEGLQSYGSEPAIRCWKCLQYTALEPASAAMLRETSPARSLHTPAIRSRGTSAPVRSPAPLPVPTAATAAYSGYAGHAGHGHRFEVPQVPCKAHPSEPVQFFCITCENGCMCAECAVHGDHGGHLEQVMSLRKAYPYVRALVEQMLATYSEKLDEIKAGEIAMEGKLRHLSSMSEQAKLHTTKVFALVRDCLADKERELAGRIAEEIKSRADDVEREAHSLRSRKVQLQENQDIITRHMKLDDPVATLSWYSEAKALLADLPADLRTAMIDLSVDTVSVSRLGGAIDGIRDHVRALEGVKFLDDLAGHNGPPSYQFHQAPSPAKQSRTAHLAALSTPLGGNLYTNG